MVTEFAYARSILKATLCGLFRFIRLTLAPFQSTLPAKGAVTTHRTAMLATGQLVQCDKFIKKSDTDISIHGILKGSLYDFLFRFAQGNANILVP